MRWVYFWAFLVIGCMADEPITTEQVPTSTPTINLDGNLRRALLKALTELENEENVKLLAPGNNEATFTKAIASAVTVLAEPKATQVPQAIKEPEEDIEVTTEAERSEVIVQKSDSIQSKPILTVVKTELDPISEAENFLTSATNNFNPQLTKVSHEKIEETKAPEVSSRINAINQVDITTVVARRPTIETTTPTTTTTSTEESEAKAEEIQFFNAPLVAAFTVHQDERGLPKKVEPIYKTTPTSRKPNTTEQKIIEQAKLREQAIIKQQIVEQQRIRQQFEIQEKQKALEQEVKRLREIQQRQDVLLRQQLQREKLLEEEIRLRNSGLPFIPVSKTPINNQIIQSTELKSVQRPVIKQEAITSESKPITKTKTQVITLQPSITFDPLLEAGKLPSNGQVLPVKNAINFHQPIIQTSNFQQYHSLPQQHIPNIATIRNFQPILFEQDFNSFTTPRSNRVFRQEVDTGNFFNRNVNQNFGNTFSIQQSVQPAPAPQANRFFRSNLESTFTAPSLHSSFSIQPSIEQPSAINFNNFNAQPVHQTRFFRSNLESHHVAPNNYQPYNQQSVHGHLNNLLYNSGIVRNNEQQENLGIVSKVLSLNHDSFFAGSSPLAQQVLPPPVKSV